jgi:hypothetical protein
MRARAKLLGWGIIGMLASGSVQAQNNPGFENSGVNAKPTGLSGWTYGSNWSNIGDYLQSVPGTPHTGNGMAISACGGVACLKKDSEANAFGWLYQDLATTIGQSYTLSFWLKVGGSPELGQAQFQAFFGNTQAFNLSSLTGAPQYVQYTNNALVATASVTRLEFVGFNAPSYNFLDDVSVTANPNTLPVTTAPEPASVALMAGGLLGLLVVSRRRTRRGPASA